MSANFWIVISVGRFPREPLRMAYTVERASPVLLATSLGVSPCSSIACRNFCPSAMNVMPHLSTYVDAVTMLVV